MATLCVGHAPVAAALSRAAASKRTAPLSALTPGSRAASSRQLSLTNAVSGSLGTTGAASLATRRSVRAYANKNAPVVAAAAAAAPRGADMKALAYSVLAGVVIWFLPAPAGVTPQAWHALAHFVGTIVGIITSVRQRARTRRGRAQAQCRGGQPQRSNGGPSRAARAA